MYRKLYLALILVLILSGCATRVPSDLVFNKDNKYQTPEFSVAHYKSPELRGDNQRIDMSVAVALSGGGHRAGNYGIGILKEIEEINCGSKQYNVLNEIDYLSTVSGGGLAAGIYLSTLYDHKRSHERNSYSLTRIIDDNSNDHARNLERGYHNVLTRALVNLKSLGNNDRGDFLEEEFDNKILGYESRKRSLTFGDVFVPRQSAKLPVLPMWVTNATVYENGSIFPFHPESLRQYMVTKYTHRLSKIELDDDYYGMPLAVGLKASASFPGAVPATTLQSGFDKKNKYIHLFDGGLSDNLAVDSALRMLASTGESEKVLIVVDAYNGQPEPFSSQEGSPTIMQIFLRTTGISLDAWRIRHKTIIDQLSSSDVFNGKRVKVVYLSFDDLPNSIKVKVEKIGTNFNISEQDQSVLFESAKTIVDANRNAIIQAVYGESCDGRL